MSKAKPVSFTATIDIIGINPFVYLPEKVLAAVFKQAGKDKGKIPVAITIDGHSFTQTLVKYAGHWRLYLNTPMRKAAAKELGDMATFTIAYDSIERTIPMHASLQKALVNNEVAKAVFDSLSPSLQHEIVRYIAHLKTEAAIEMNVLKAIDFLLGKGRFAGRDLSVKKDR